MFNNQAREEGVISEKQAIRIKSMKCDDKKKHIDIEAEIYNLMEN